MTTGSVQRRNMHVASTAAKALSLFGKHFACIISAFALMETATKQLLKPAFPHGSTEIPRYSRICHASRRPSKCCASLIAHAITVAFTFNLGGFDAIVAIVIRSIGCHDGSCTMLNVRL